MELKKEFDIPWVAEFGDLWAGNDFNQNYLKKELLYPLGRLLESRIYRGEQTIVKKADRVIVVHPHHKEWISQHFVPPQNKVEVVTGGYSESDFQDLRPNRLYSDKPTIVFLGSYYHQFKESLRDFLKTVEELDPEFEVAFIGRGSVYLDDSVPNLTRILHLPKPKAFSFALGADFLFVVMPAYAKWTPGKTYEYLRLGKPILALVPEDSDPAKIIRRAKAGFVLSHDVNKMKEQLKDIFDRWRTGNLTDFQPDRQYIAKFERRKLAGRIAEIFDEVAESRVRK